MLAGRAERAGSFWLRAKGLLGRKQLLEGEALILERCKSVHMFFMRFPIDVVFCNEANEVVRICSELHPWRISPYVAKADYVVELPAATAAVKELQVGDRLLFRPSSAVSSAHT